MREKEKFAVYSHAFGAILASGGVTILWIKALTVVNTSSILSLLAYSFALLFLFIASTIYHFKMKNDNEMSIWRKMDHIAIYVMIAGTYTPIAYFYLDSRLSTLVIAIQWLLVAVGSIHKVFFIKTAKWLVALIYLIQGWMAVIFLQQLLVIMSASDTILLVTGGFAYSVGAILYIFDSNNTKIIGLSLHDYFHILVLIGAFLHWIVVFHTLGL